MESLTSPATEQIREQINELCAIVEELGHELLNEEWWSDDPWSDDPQNSDTVDELVRRARKVTGLGWWESRPGEEDQ